MGFSIADDVVVAFYTECEPPQLLVKCVAAITILIIAIINVQNVRFAVRVQVAFLVAKVLVLTLAAVQNSSVVVKKP